MYSSNLMYKSLHFWYLLSTDTYATDKRNINRGGRIVKVWQADIRTNKTDKYNARDGKNKIRT